VVKSGRAGISVIPDFKAAMIIPFLIKDIAAAFRERLGFEDTQVMAT